MFGAWRRDLQRGIDPAWSRVPSSQLTHSPHSALPLGPSALLQPHLGAGTWEVAQQHLGLAGLSHVFQHLLKFKPEGHRQQLCALTSRAGTQHSLHRASLTHHMEAIAPLPINTGDGICAGSAGAWSPPESVQCPGTQGQHSARGRPRRVRPLCHFRSSDTWHPAKGCHLMSLQYLDMLLIF